MGSQVEEIVLLVLSLAVCSILLGTMFQVLRGWFHGYMDRWEEKYLVNKKAEYLDENILSVNDPLPGEENDEWEDDPDVMAFLEHADKQGPYSDEDDKIYTVGGLTADKDQGFKKFINKIEGSNSDNNDDEKIK